MKVRSKWIKLDRHTAHTSTLHQGYRATDPRRLYSSATQAWLRQKCASRVLKSSHGVNKGLNSLKRVYHTIFKYSFNPNTKNLMILRYFDAGKYENPFLEFFRFWGGPTPPNENEGGSGPPRLLCACLYDVY